MQRTAIFLNGSTPDIRQVKNVLNKNDFIIAADGAAAFLLKHDFLPQIIIGDFDSLSPEAKKRAQEKNIPLFTYPVEKDQTDSELAIEYALEHGATELILFGVFGDRADHMLANILLCAKIAQRVTIRIVGAAQTLYFVTDKFSISGQAGQTVSLLPLFSDVTGIATTGLKWQLSDDTLTVGSTRGISNVLIESSATIIIRSGVLLVVQHGAVTA